MLTCPSCGAGWDEISCLACGYAKAPEELIASWVATGPAEPPSAGDDVCLVCGYEGPMVLAPDGGRGVCPACGDPWRDRGGVIMTFACTECGRVIPLTEEHRGRTVICPGCRSLLGCPIDHEKRKRVGRSTILDVTALSAAVVMGYMVASGFWEQRVPWRLVHGCSAVALPIAWTLTAMRFLDPRRRRFLAPGFAACLAVSVASLVNLWCALDAVFAKSQASHVIFMAVALRVVNTVPLAAAVAGVWAVLVFDRRWRPEPGWRDQAGRILGIYWLAAGMVVPLLRMLF